MLRLSVCLNSWLDSWAGRPTGIGGIIGPEADRVVIGLSIGIVAILVAIFWRTLKSDAVIRFSALGALLAAIPFCATAPADRLMFIGGLGTARFAARIIAKVIEGPSDQSHPPLNAWYHRWPAAIWLITIVLLSPLLLPSKSQSITKIGEPSHLAATRITIDEPDQTW